MNKEIAIVGLGKMGGNIVRKLIEKGWTVYGYDQNPETVAGLVGEGMQGAATLTELATKLSGQKLIWIIVPAGKPVDAVITELLPTLVAGDVIIDGGNSHYEDSMARGAMLAEKGIQFIDVGCSGGPHSILAGGACLMIGGDRKGYEANEELFKDIARPNGYKFFEGAGAGHFVKMVHNGIEYGMMQSLAEGFSMMHESPFKLNLIDVADIYNNGSIIESRLVGWIKGGLEKYGIDLKDISGTVAHNGEGEWTIKTAEKLGHDVASIKLAFDFRVASDQKPSFTGKMLTLMRNMFGGHDAQNKGWKPPEGPVHS